MIGQTVTHYRIIDKIGEGGMGVVYRAEDTRLGRQVAVKFLSSKLLDDPAALERFQREARAASSLNNPHICALYDIGQHEGVPFLVMELLEGTTLRSRISGTPIATDTLLDIAVQAADALDTAHSAGRSEPCRRCRQSRRAARTSTDAAISFRSASCSTKWRRAANRSSAARRR
jgi:serine/threonine protein kinase